MAKTITGGAMGPGSKSKSVGGIRTQFTNAIAKKPGGKR